MYIAVDKDDLHFLQQAVNELREKMIEKEVHDDLYAYVTELDVRIATMYDTSFVV